MTHEHEPVEGTPSKQTDLSAGMIVAAAVVVLVIVFIFQNTARSSVSFLWLDFDAPTWVWFIVMFLIGVAIGWVAHMVYVRRRAKKLSA